MYKCINLSLFKISSDLKSGYTKYTKPPVNSISHVTYSIDFKVESH
jgi:hypothetical protein